MAGGKRRAGTQRVLVPEGIPAPSPNLLSDTIPEYLEVSQGSSEIPAENPSADPIPQESAAGPTTTAPEHAADPPPVTTSWTNAFVVWIPVLLLTAVVLVLRVLSIPDALQERDSIFFVRGVENYDVPRIRPHWPGYPVFIWLGKLVHVWVPSAADALHLVSAASTTLCLIPIFAITRIWRTQLGGTQGQAFASGCVATLLAATVPTGWVDGIEVFSDPAALFLALMMLWACIEATRPGYRMRAWGVVAAAALGGLLMGTRLSYITLLLPIAYLTLMHFWSWSQSRGHRIPWLPIVAVAAFFAMVGVWLGWQIFMDGFYPYLEAARRHLKGHYGQWGGTAATDPNPASRPTVFVMTLLLYGLGGWWPGAPVYRIPGTILWGGLALLGTIRMWKAPFKPPAVVASLWFLPYMVWLVFGQAVFLPRQHLPLVMMMCIVAALGLPSGHRYAMVMACSLWGFTAGVAWPQAVGHKEQGLIEAQMGEFFREHLQRSKVALITKATVPVLKSTAPRLQIVPYKPIPLTQLAVPLQKQGTRVFASRTLLLRMDQLTGDWTPAAQFCQPRYMRPGSGVEVLYEFTPGSPERSVPDCYVPQGKRSSSS